MTTTFRLMTAAAVASALLSATPADARTTARLQDACEDAVRSELGDGHTRIKRVSSTQSDGVARFWLTVRHKSDTAAKSSRYRVLCAIDDAASEPTIELETGWWQQGSRGQPPIATD